MARSLTLARTRAVWTLAAGDLLIVPPGEPHRLVEARDSACWRVGFCVPCLTADASASLLEPVQRVRRGACPVVTIPRRRRRFLESLFAELEGASPAAGGDEALVRGSLLTLILREVVCAARWPAASAAAGSVVGEALRFIERHCFERLTPGDVAAAVSRTPSYITTALTSATGRSAGAWIIAGRMAEARRRLLHSDESVEAVADRVGYADVTHFIRIFRRTHGATPAVWRTRHGGAVTRGRRPPRAPR